MQNKTVLVTGSSRGIGKAIAIKYAKEGYSVIINCAHREEELLAAKKEIERYQVPCLSFLGDISNYDVAARLFQQVSNTFGHLDVLVNNAGISYIGLFTEMTPSDWHKVIDTNLTSVFNCCRLAAPLMISRKSGKIINISSVWGLAGASCEVAYSASKGGIHAFTKALAKELAPSNIQVNAIACGVIDTEMNGFLSAEDKDSLVEEIPANRFGTSEEVGELVYQLTHGNEYLTGQIISLDGGWI
ncbi:MAG: SDR family oxidoreductase [Anaerocolumna aminovalerica]|jgi:3-oxoacyl-[acyl-carrier protein] reductase|uniref:elongation factor P 5-aminopentanone reductase n=1 Tax=Anaerocolumna aminovalerica TaxID=1527 RepID=UPI000BE4342A|nr:SDR family oxidoreductase [Anaerocolumna aminovalerica]MDU6266690.1 SDR family oxidoreductase [Anaerocolumna aminovalerica]